MLKKNATLGIFLLLFALLLFSVINEIEKKSKSYVSRKYESATVGNQEN